MSDRYIIIPKPAEFRDGYTKKLVKVQNEQGQMIDHPDRPFDWFIHVFILSHLQFSQNVGGYDATKAGKQIAKALEKAMDAEEEFFTVSTDNWRRLNCTIARPDDKYQDEPLKENPNPRILSLSAHGMTREMDNFTASCFEDHMDAIANASTNKPEPKPLPPAEEAQAPIPAEAAAAN